MASRPILPEWVLEIARPEQRSNLWVGIWSGYVVTICFGLLAFAAMWADVIEYRPAFYVLLAAKLVTNTVALGALRRDVLVLETQSINTVMDLVAMTGAIYLTGGPLSPVFGVYVIVIAVLALLTNVGVTILASVLAWLMHAGVTLLVLYGALPAIPAPGSTGVLTTGPQVAIALIFSAFLLGATSTFTSLLVRRLQQKTTDLQARTEQLIRANAQRTMLLANVTHELRTPIHGICGLTDVLDAEIYGPISAAQREAHGSIRGAAKSLLHMIDDLLALSKAEAGAMKLNLSEVDVIELLETVAGSVQWMIGTKELELEQDSALDLPDHLVTDRGKLVQILINLMVNAVKFTPQGGSITLRASCANQGVVFDVIDSGVGIAQADLERIFEAFEQGDASDEREFGGTGLGLAIVQRLVVMIDGEVEAQSEPGKGSCFSVWIPLALDSDDSGQLLLDVSGTHRVAAN